MRAWVRVDFLSFLPWIILSLWMGIGWHLGGCMFQRDMLYACHLIPVRSAGVVPLIVIAYFAMMQ
jgi:hypothetical protein